MTFKNRDDKEKHVSFTLETANTNGMKVPDLMKKEAVDEKLQRVRNIENHITKLQLYTDLTRRSVVSFANSRLG